MRRSKSFIVGFFVVLAAVFLSGCSTQKAGSEGPSSATITLNLNEGYDFTFNELVTNEDNADIYLKLYDNVPTLFFKEWVAMSNVPFAEVSTVDIGVTPKLTSVQAQFLAFHLPNLTMLSKNQDGNFVKYQITDTDGVVPTELGFTYIEDEFTYTIMYVINREGVPEF